MRRAMQGIKHMLGREGVLFGILFADVRQAHMHLLQLPCCRLLCVAGRLRVCGAAFVMPERADVQPGGTVMHYFSHGPPLNGGSGG